MFHNFFRFKIFAGILFLVFFDQIFKNAALAFLNRSRLPEDYLFLELHKNYGVAFGLPISSDIFYFTVFIFFILILIGLKKGIFGDWRKMDGEKFFALVFIIAGALGNIIDRIRFGYIIDYMNIGGALVFNLADVLILAGVVIFLKDLFFKKNGKPFEFQGRI